MTNEEALIKGCEALARFGAEPDYVECVDVDRMVDDWYDRAPLFPGDRPGDTWREHAVPFRRKQGNP